VAFQRKKPAVIRDLSTEPKKRELFTRLAEHFKTLATELEGVLSGQRDGPIGS
jgi:hypothetical protein